MALQRARHAVQLDSSDSDIPSAIAAYGEAIELLQTVIARRSRKPGNEAEVKRVMHIHDRYADRVRELCRARRLPLPSHVSDAPSAPHDPLRDRPPDAESPPTSTLALSTGAADLAYHESEWDTEHSLLLPSPSSSSASPIDSSHHPCHEWIVSEACDEEVKEWGQHLNGSGGDDRRTSVASSAVWSTIAVSHG